MRQIGMHGSTHEWVIIHDMHMGVHGGDGRIQWCVRMVVAEWKNNSSIASIIINAMLSAMCVCRFKKRDLNPCKTI